MKMLNKVGANYEPYGTHDNRILKILSASFILTPCYLLFKKGYKNVKASVVNPYARSLYEGCSQTL